MTVNYIVVAQWQGSGSSRALQLVDGAEAIRGDLPAASTHAVEIPLEAGDQQDSGVRRVSSLLLVRERTHRAYAADPAIHLTIGGDSGVELAALEHVSRDSPAVVWIDAHARLHTPESSSSGAFNGMVLRTLLGEGAPSLLPTHPLTPDRVILAGVRSADPEEDSYIRESGIRSIEVSEFSADALLAAIAATGANSVYLHINLDVLDPADFAGLGSPVPFGITPTVLAESIRGIVARYPLVGAGLTEFAPASISHTEDDLPTILRIIGAITSAR